MRKMCMCVLVVICASVMCGSVFAANVVKALPVSQGAAAVVVEGPMTALDVLQMSCAGLSDNVIVSKMVSTGASFDLSVADIIELKKAGVSDPVINYMINSKNTVSGTMVSSLPKASTVEYVAPVTTYVVPQTTTYYVEQPTPPISLSFAFGDFGHGPGPCWRGGGWGHGRGPGPGPGPRPGPGGGGHRR